MMIMPIRHPDQETLGLVEQLRDALKYADAQRRCIISGKVRVALSAADEYLATPEGEFPSLEEAPPQIPRL